MVSAQALLEHVFLASELISASFSPHLRPFVTPGPLPISILPSHSLTTSTTTSLATFPRIFPSLKP